jgi:molybdopterin converting factor small subunit
MVKLIFHGRFSAIAGSSEITVPCPPGIATLSDLCAWISTSMPNLDDALKGRGVATIVNFAVVRDLHHPVTDDDEVAFLPPMSGG